MGKIPLRILGAFVLLMLGLWWLWPSSSSSLGDPDIVASGSSEQLNSRTEPLVSAIQPISNAEASTEQGVLSGDFAPTSNAPAAMVSTKVASLAVATPIDDAFKERFEDAVELIETADQRAAISALEALIDANPSAVEPYINLASLYAKQGNLDVARKTLSPALYANPNTGLLFESLQKVHGAQAAQAYKQALNVAESGAQIALPIVSSIASPVAPAAEAPKVNEGVSNQIGELQQLNQNLIASNDSLKRDNDNLLLEQKNFNDQLSSFQTVAENLELKANNLELESKSLELAKQSLEAENKSLQGELVKLEQKSLERVAFEEKSQQEAVKSNAAALRQLQEQLAQSQKQLVQVEKSHQNELAEIKGALEAKTIAASNARKAIQELQAERTRSEGLAASSDKPSTPKEAENVPSDGNAKRDKAVVAAVESWARSWSAQDVDAYIAHYRDGYTPPGSGLTHNQWLAQREVRLTNKQFIDVSVTNFKVSKVGSGEQVAVTFSQHYRSNTVDDRISKRLILAKSGEDWHGAKIVAERVVSR